MTLNDTLKHNPETTTNKWEESRTLPRTVSVMQGLFKLWQFCLNITTSNALSSSFFVVVVVYLLQDWATPSLCIA